MSSLYSLFGSTRDILRKAGPKVGASTHSVGGIAIAVLNQRLRPFLSQWHPALQTWEAQKADDISPQAHEQSWVDATTVRQELESLRQNLEQYANALAKIAGVNE